jgi:hypothetical protein
MTLPQSERPTYQPSAFACAVAAMMTMDDSADDELRGCVFLEKVGSPGWRVWKQVYDWRVDEGDTLYGNFEVRDRGEQPLAFRAFLPEEASVQRHVWAAVKEQQLGESLRQMHAGGTPLLRWVAAMVDVMPLRYMESSLSFRRSLVRDEFELNAINVDLQVRRVEAGWELRANKRIGNEIPEYRVVPLDAHEPESLCDVMFDAWIYGRRPT